MKRFKYAILFTILALALIVGANDSGYMTVLDNWYFSNSGYSVPTFYDYLILTPTTSPGTTTEGHMYWDDVANAPKWYNGSSWVTAGTSSGGDSLDTAYDNGSGITVDGDALTLTTGAAVNNSALAIVHGETTNDNDAMSITNSADSTTAVSIQIDSSAGYDIQGTGDVWRIEDSGLAVLVGITTTGTSTVTAADQLWDDTYDMFWDTSKDHLLFNDLASLGFGGASGDDPDVHITWDTSNLLIESAAEDTGEIQVGATNAIDLVLYANTNTSEIAFNANTATAEFNGYDIQLMDDDKLAFGDSDEFVIEYNEDGSDELLIVALNANDSVVIGTDAANTDFTMQGTTASTYAKFDSSADEMFFDLADLKISDGSQIEFVDASDGIDWSIDCVTAETLLFYPTEETDDQTINFGNATNTTDFRLFGATASTVVFDASANLQTNVNYDILLDDASTLIFGTGSDISMYSDNADTLEIDPGAAGDTLKLGTSDTDALNVIWYADVSGDTVTFDEENKMVEFEDVTLALGDQTYILFGDTIGTGDISVGVNGTALSIDGVVAGTGSVLIGNDDDDITLKWFAETASSYFQFTGDQFQAVAANIVLDASSQLIDAVKAGTKVVTGTPHFVVFRPDAAATLTYTIPTGYDFVVTDAWGYKTAANGAHNDDEVTIQNNDGSAANIFTKVEFFDGGAVNDGVRFAFTGLIDTENEVEATKTLDLVGNENAATGVDCIITVVGYFKVHD